MTNERSSNSRLSVIEQAEHMRRLKMWEMRMAFIHNGRRFMQVKQYRDAAVSYEKYIRTLEIIFKVPPGTLNPEVFKENSRTAEMSVLAGAYWDLIRIYDSNTQYSDRQEKYAQQLIKFSPVTPVHNEIVNKAQVFIKTARNPDKIKIFLSGVGKGSRCFIATAAYSSSIHPDVMTLRNYRDQVLKQNFWGRKFIYFYYRHSPRIACILDRHESLKAPTRWALKLVIKCVR